MSTTVEFARTMAFLEAACGKTMPKESAMVYFELLGDLPNEVLEVAAKRISLEHKWATFPSIAEIREAASETMRGSVRDLSAAEAWQLAWDAAGKIDLEIQGSLERRTAGLPEIVLQAMRAFGLPALVYGKEPLSIVRAQFIKIFEQLAGRERRMALMPASLKNDIARIGVCPVDDGRLLPGG
jgi:hypothetical protein